MTRISDFFLLFWIFNSCLLKFIFEAILKIFFQKCHIKNPIKMASKWIIICIQDQNLMFSIKFLCKMVRMSSYKTFILNQRICPNHYVCLTKLRPRECVIILNFSNLFYVSKVRSDPTWHSKDLNLCIK